MNIQYTSKALDLQPRAASVVMMDIERASAKIRARGVVDDEEDYALPIYAERLPVLTGIAHRVEFFETCARSVLAPPMLGSLNAPSEAGTRFVTFGKFLLGVALAGAGAVHLWHVHERSVINRELLAAGDSNGFVAVVTPSNLPADTAVILAPVNCPSAQAQRADSMAAKLGQMGITVSRSNQYSASIHNPDQMPLLTRTNEVLGGEIPIVIVNGMAKANPTVDEVAAELSRAK